MTTLLATYSIRIFLIRWCWLSFTISSSIFLLTFSLTFGLPPRKLSFSLSYIYRLCTPFMRHFPYSKLSVLTCREEYIFVLVIMNHFDLFCEGALKHDYALSLFFDVSNLQISTTCSFAVTWHSLHPSESCNTFFRIVNSIWINVFYYSRFHLSLVYQLDDINMPWFHLADQNVSMMI